MKQIRSVIFGLLVMAICSFTIPAVASVPSFETDVSINISSSPFDVAATPADATRHVAPALEVAVTSSDIAFRSTVGKLGKSPSNTDERSNGSTSLTASAYGTNEIGSTYLSPKGDPAASYSSTDRASIGRPPAEFAVEVCAVARNGSY